MLTQTSVINTDLSEGVIEVVWQKSEFDSVTIHQSDPYTMTLSYSNAVNGDYIPILNSRVTAPTFSEFNDKYTFVHRSINTADGQYYYKVELSSADDTIGFSTISSSVFETADPGDSHVNLTWKSLTSWQNINYTIYRKNNGQWQETGQSTTTSLIDESVENGMEYCYRVKSIGVFPQTNILDTTYNFSQEICVIPKKPLQPCKPMLTINNNCGDHF